MRVLLKGFNGQTGCRMSAIVTRSGVPISWVLPPDVLPDNFATMAATLLGALEVIYSAPPGSAPQQATVQTDRGTLVLRVITPKAFVVAVLDGSPGDALKQLEETATRARGLLAKPS